MPGEAEARRFWKENFLLPYDSLSDTVSWSKFIEALSKFTKVNISELEFLEMVFRFHDPPHNKSNAIPPPVSKISLSRFVMVVNWFGPFFIPSQAPVLLPQIKELTSKDWFHFDISTTTAEMRLNNRVNHFLIRVRTEKRDKEPIQAVPFAISKISKGSIRHKRIKFRDGKYHVEVGQKKYSFSSIVEMVNHHDLGLVNPCPKEVLDPYRDDA